MRYSGLLALSALASVALAEDMAMEVIPLSNRPASELSELLMPLLDAEDKVIDNGASLIVKTRRSKLAEIKTLIQKLDTRLNNLTISVLETSVTTAEALNAEATLNANTNGIRMRGMIANTDDTQDERQYQQLRTLEGQAAYIKAGRLHPVQDFSVSTYPTNNPPPNFPQTNPQINGYANSVSSRTRLQAVDSGFAVTPHLSGEYVNIEIAPWRNHLQLNGDIETQSAHTTLRAHLGEWVEIATNSSEASPTSSGFNGLNASTTKSVLRTLIKVDLIR